MVWQDSNINIKVVIITLLNINLRNIIKYRYIFRYLENIEQEDI